nr:MAG TPA: hypothetical protein [Caudoviricetes sp.]
MKSVICARASGEHIGVTFTTSPVFEFSHHAHPFSTHISSRIGPATMQAFRSRAIRRDGSMPTGLPGAAKMSNDYPAANLSAVIVSRLCAAGSEGHELAGPRREKLPRRFD